MRDENNVVEIDGLKTCFFTDTGTVMSVNGVSFDIPKNKIVGVVGESGCGKSVTSLSIMQLVQAPQGQTEGVEIYVQDGAGWRKAETELMGIYHLFSANGSSVKIAVSVTEKGIMDYIAFIAAGAAALILVIAVIVHKKRKKRKSRRAENAAVESEDGAETLAN